MKLETYNTKLIFVAILLFSIFLFSTTASAQVIGNWDFLKGIVPCGTSYANHACTVCDFFVLIQNIINFLLYAFASLATLAVIYIAFLFLFSGGSPAKIIEAKGKLWLVVIGIFWVLGSWLVLNTILNLIVDQSVFPWPWNQINCEVSQPQIPLETSVLPELLPWGLEKGGLSEEGARAELRLAGFTINKNPCPIGIVSYESVAGGCTSLGGLKPSTIEKAIQLKKDCNCDIEITGGTEPGHAKGAFGHANGYKLDFRPNQKLDSYIQTNFEYVGIRSDGAKQYAAPNGMIMVREGDHWDATFIKL